MNNQNGIANEILNQLGGNKFIAMTGAIICVTNDNSLALKFKGCNKANYMRITLNSMDTYTMEFAKISRTNVFWHSKKDFIYNDMLQTIFTSVTGLDTKL